jgi:hypothetical protein
VLVLAVLAGACSPAVAAKPIRFGHYYGFQASESSPGGPTAVVGELRISSSGRRFEPRSYVELRADCPGRGARLTVNLARRRGRPVGISRMGRFSAAGSVGRLRYRLRGRFPGRQYARIRYTVARRGRNVRGCRVPRYPVTMYLDGERPFSGCRSQKARTVSSSPDGRVFEQYRLEHSEFWPHDYACLYDSANEQAVLLGRNWDDAEIAHPQVRGAYGAYASVGCGVGGCGAGIVVKLLALGDVTVKRAPSVFDERDTSETVGSLVLKANGSVAWITARSATWPGVEPMLPARVEVYAFDERGWRMLDTGPGIEAESLRLNETSSTLSWVNAGVTKTDTLH